MNEKNNAPERIFLPETAARLAAVSPELQEVEGAWWIRAPISEGDEALARSIIKRMSDAAIELVIMRHSLCDDDGEEPPTEDIARWKSDVVNCMTGDDIGCNDPEELDETNCEILWLNRVLATVRKEAREAAFRENVEPWAQTYRHAFVGDVINELRTAMEGQRNEGSKERH